LNFTLHSSGRTLALGLSTALLALLVSCGGGGGDPGSPPFGNGDGGAATVRRLSLVLTNASGAPAASLPNSGTEQITATVTALDSNNAVVPNAAISFSVNEGAVVAPSGNGTDASGRLAAFVGIGADRSSRSVTVTARSGNGSLSASASFLVTGAKLTATTPPIAAPGAEIAVTYTLEDASGNAMPGQTVALTGNGSAIGEEPTDGTGKATFRFNVPATPGALTLNATAAGESLERVVQVQSAAVPPASGVVVGASVAANPNVVSVNTSSTSNATTVRALFRGANNATIRNVRVWFTLPDPNSVGGSFSDTGLVYSDSTGTASTTYIPGAVSSPTDGVVVLACYSNVDFEIPSTPGVCPPGTVSNLITNLTVVDQALRLDIGTDELITLGNITYIKDFVVVVVDAAGRAKADVEITPKLDLVAFYKGFYGWNGETWVRNLPVGVLQLPACPNEDVNRSGFLEAGEDVNGNGKLDPGGVTITMVGSSKTDSSGKATVRIEYPRDRATWIDFVISVTGRVGGSEGLAVYQGTLGGLGNLPAPGEAFKNEAVSPAFQISPYGRSAGCNNTN
jgi:Invasin, domain 3